jgi:adenylate kinase
MSAIFIVLLGPPGVGKGTQSRLLSENLGLPHVSTGEIFRANIVSDSEMGKQASSYMARGALVPDKITIDMVNDYITRPNCVNGVLLDGFPRNLMQAEALNDMMESLDSTLCVISIQVPEETLVKRVAGRRICRENGHTYHLSYKPPLEPGICDEDGSELFQREDDREETVAYRVRIYQDQTEPLVKYYRDLGKLETVDGMRSISEVAEHTAAIVKRASTGREKLGQV